MDDDVMDLTPRKAPTLQGTLEMLAADEVFVDYLCRVTCRAIDRGVVSNGGLRSVMAEAIRNAPLFPPGQAPADDAVSRGARALRDAMVSRASEGVAGSPEEYVRIVLRAVGESGGSDHGA